MNGMRERLGSLPHISAWLLGCAFVRAWLGIVITQSHMTDGPLSWPGGGHAVLMLGELIGFFAIAFYARGRGRLGLRAGASGAFATCSLVGSLAVVFFLALGLGTSPTRALFGSIGLFVCGIGYALGLMLWIETFGTLPTGKAVLAWTSSYLVNFLIWSLTQGADATETSVLLLAFPLLALICLTPAAHVCDEDRQTQSATGNETASGRRLPWLLIMWVAVFGFMYGLGNSATGLAYSTLPARLGMAVPAVIAIFGITFGSRRFDLHVLLIVSVVGMILGMVTSFALDAPATLAQVFMSAANEAYLMFAYAFVCFVAQRTGTGAAAWGGLVGGANVAMLQVGSWAGEALAPMISAQGVAGPLVGICSVVLIVAVTLAAVYNRDYLDSFTLAQETTGENAEARLLATALKAGLSPKEAAVLVPLVGGKSLSEIADELFLAPGTIRAHTNNIYRKLGVHSRSELISAIAQLQKETETIPLQVGPRQEPPKTASRRD